MRSGPLGISLLGISQVLSILSRGRVSILSGKVREGNWGGGKRFVKGGTSSKNVHLLTLVKQIPLDISSQIQEKVPSI